jgi:uncharacterized membrane protein
VNAGFWLSHHPDDELHRAYRLGGHAVCARCLGLYPVMFAAIVAQFAVAAPLAWAWDGAWTVGGLVPAVADWTFGRFAPDRGTNAWRTLTGILAGMALGRTMYIHLQKPFPMWLWAQAAVVTAAVVAVILATYARRIAR